MRKIILGLVAATAVAAPIAVAGSANAAPAPAPKANGSVTWTVGDVTGTVTFDANNKTGGTLDYVNNSNGMWLHGVVAPGTVKVLDDRTAIFGGTITAGSTDYLSNPRGANYFTAKVVDGGTSGRNGDMIAVLANQDGFGNWLVSTDSSVSASYPMHSDTAGTVTGGNLTVH